MAIIMANRSIIMWRTEQRNATEANRWITFTFLFLSFFL